MSTVPDLEWTHPPCPMCGVETSCDNTSWWCEGCGATWDNNGMNGERP